MKKYLDMDGTKVNCTYYDKYITGETLKVYTDEDGYRCVDVGNIAKLYSYNPETTVYTNNFAFQNIEVI